MKTKTRITAQLIEPPPVKVRYDLRHGLLYCVQYVSETDSAKAQIVARLLLHCYNGKKYPFEIGELRKLKDTYPIFSNALAVIQVRAEFQRPHVFFENGTQLFKQIARDFRIKPQS